MVYDNKQKGGESTMTNERKGEIALAIVTKMIVDKGIKLRPGMNRQLAQEAKDLGIAYVEMKEFVVGLYREAFEKQMTSLDTIPFGPSTTRHEDDFLPRE
jgi:hypothetical protein